jgi:Holliday junction resolvasome RuvABC endonuclease subunit
VTAPMSHVDEPEAPMVVGLDLSITSTGIAHTDGSTAHWPLTAAHGDTRLNTVADRTLSALQPFGRWAIDLVVIEDLLAKVMGDGIKSAMVHGAVRFMLIDNAIPYLLVSPPTLKTYATGKGNATKPDLRMSLFQRTGVDLRNDDEVDAWWLRALGLDLLGHPVLDLPQTHRRALAKLTLPEGVTTNGAR